jgi:glycosyltransferase involved in cell wall biosynthesis
MCLKNLEFRASLPKTEMPAVIGAADACIAILKPVDTYKTTYPNKVFDYMACAKPVVLAIDGVIREVLEAAHCGLFCQPGDPQKMSEAILKLYRDPAAARDMGVNGRRYLEMHFDRAQIAGKFIKAVEDLVDGYGRKNTGC